MSGFDRSNLRTGREAIEKANEDRQRGGGDFKPFLPSIYWKDDGSYQYVLFLNTIDDIPSVEFHPFVELEDGKPHQIMARTEPSIGESVDPIERDWDYKPRLTGLSIAVELDVTTKVVNGRERPAGFEVKTVEFERRIRDDKGELTEEREAVVAPCVGFITQSPYNFYNVLASFDASEAPIDRTPLKITRVGKNNNVTYQLVGYEDLPVDLSALIDGIEFISYLGDSTDELLEALEGTDDQWEQASIIGNHLLDLKLDELSSQENYDELYGQITKPSRYGSKDKKSDSKPARATRPSQRRSSRAAAVDSEPTGDPEVAPEGETSEASEAKPASRSRKASETVTKASPAKERLEAIRARSAGK